MYSLVDLLAHGDPYGPTAGGIVALKAGDVPDISPQWTPASPFALYAGNVFNLARTVIMWWTPARVEHEALRMAGNESGPSVLSQEAYAFRGIYLQLATLIVESLPSLHPDHSGRRHIEMRRDLLEQAVSTLERKAQQVEARAMDLRMRYDAEKLRSMLGALDVSPKLGRLIDCAQRDNEAHEHLAQVAEEVGEALRQTVRSVKSIQFIADSYWDHALDKRAEARRVTTMVEKIGETTGDAMLKALMSALVDTARRHL